MRAVSPSARRSRTVAFALVALTGSAIVLGACTGLMDRYNNSPGWQAAVAQDREQDKKGNGCLKC